LSPFEAAGGHVLNQTQVSAKASRGPGAACIIFGAFALLLWLAMVPMLNSLTGSDAAGNGMAQGFAALAIFATWAMLGVLFLIAWGKGEMPIVAALAGLVLIPASCVVAMMALDLLSHPYDPPYFWPIIPPTAIPPLVVVFCFWTVMPPARAAIPAGVAAGAIWGAVFILCIAIVPMQMLRNAANEAKAEAERREEQAFVALPKDAPLWDWVPYLSSRNAMRQTAAVEGIRKLARRQSEAEIMLDRGDFPLGFIGQFDIDLTPAVCEKTLTLLRSRAAQLVPPKPDTQPYSQVAVPVGEALTALSWLIGYGCASDAEVRAWEDVAKAYQNPAFDVYELKGLHDPKRLGQTLRETPEKFSQLSPKSHLKAWLSFADKAELRDAALKGARSLNSRTADAIEMLNADEFAAYAALLYMPVLDLTATPQLCSAALKALRPEFARIYKPGADDPRPYSELLDRMGTGAQLPALQWLARNGCDADAELGTAIVLVEAYRESPGRAQMLATLNGLRRKQ
jgi:hypothetical protein